MYRIARSHLFLSDRYFGPAAGSARGAIQGVLVTLRWDPLDDRLIGVGFDPGLDALAASTRYPPRGRNRRNDTCWTLKAGPAVRDWALALGMSWPEMTQFYLLELSACNLLDDQDPAQGQRAAIEAYRASGGRSLYTTDQNFFWCSSYHLARPAGFAPRSAGDQTPVWHAEGGSYERKFATQVGAYWCRRRRLAGQPDPADRRAPDVFDPKPRYRLEGFAAEQASFDLGPGQAALPLSPFIARLGSLEPWPENPLTRIPEPFRPPSPQPALVAWFKPSDPDLVMRWSLSPPLVF